MSTDATIATDRLTQTPAKPQRSPAYEHYLRSLRLRALSIQGWQIGLVAAFLIIWEVAPRNGWINPMLTSYPSAVARTFMTMLRDGTLVCLHGSYVKGALRVIFSTDGGHTWIAPAKDYGFLVDRCYGYGKAMELPDGSLFIVDQGTGGHATKDAQNMSIRCLRLRIRADHSGIDLLPAPNR